MDGWNRKCSIELNQTCRRERDGEHRTAAARQQQKAIWHTSLLRLFPTGAFHWGILSSAPSVLWMFIRISSLKNHPHQKPSKFLPTHQTRSSPHQMSTRQIHIHSHTICCSGSSAASTHTVFSGIRSDHQQFAEVPSFFWYHTLWVLQPIFQITRFPP